MGERSFNDDVLAVLNGDDLPSDVSRSKELCPSQREMVPNKVELAVAE